MMKSIKKERLAKIINFGDYKSIANEFSLLIGEKEYKSKDKFSPKEVKELLKHIDLSESRQEERLLHYSDFKDLSLWYFGIIIIYYEWKRKHCIQQKI